MAGLRVPPLAPIGPEVILKPASAWFVLFTFLLAIGGNLLPLVGTPLALRPDFVALVLLYWCIQEPRLVGVGAAWILGLLMDVADATVFGQHALAYAVLAYAALHFRRRVLRFPLWQQAAQVVMLLLLCDAIVALVRVIGGANLPHWTFFVHAFIAAMLWAPMSMLFQAPQHPRRSPSEL